MLGQALAGALLAAPVTLTAADGRSVPAAWHPAPDASELARAPAVVVVTDPAEKRDAWTKAAGALGAAGFSVLAIEPRTIAKKEGFGSAAPDIAAALKWLAARRDVDASRLLLAGAGDGAMIALAAAASDVGNAELAGLALLSPSLDANRLDDATALGDWGKRPFFVAVAKGDKRAAKSALVLDGNALGPKRMHIAEGSRRGAALLANDADALTALVDWAKTATGPPGP